MNKNDLNTIAYSKYCDIAQHYSSLTYKIRSYIVLFLLIVWTFLLFKINFGTGLVVDFHDIDLQKSLGIDLKTNTRLVAIYIISFILLFLILIEDGYFIRFVHAIRSGEEIEYIGEQSQAQWFSSYKSKTVRILYIFYMMNGTLLFIDYLYNISRATCSSPMKLFLVLLMVIPAGSILYYYIKARDAYTVSKFSSFSSAKRHMYKTIKGSLDRNPKTTIDIIGVSLNHSWPFIKNNIIELLGGNKLEINIVMTEPEYLDDMNIYERKKKAEAVAKDVKEIMNDNIKFSIHYYKNIPHWHGLLINKSELYLGDANWFVSKEYDRYILKVGSNKYRRFVKNKFKTNKRIDEFINWFNYYKEMGKSKKI